MHSIFIFKVKNKDLGFVPPDCVQTPEKETKKKPEEKEKEGTSPILNIEVSSDQLQASFKIFIQFHRLKKKMPAEVTKEICIPANFSTERSSYDPDKEEIYTIGYPMSAGYYLMAMAIASPDLQKIGTSYYEFSLPDLNNFTKVLDTTPIFFIKGYKQMSEPETTVKVHKDFFAYSVLQVEPIAENVFSPGQNLDIFFFIFGTQPDEVGKYNIVTTYEVMKEGEKIIRFEPKTYNHPFISQSLPMKKTVLIKPKEGEERKETRDLEPGQYTLSVKIRDNIQGNH